MPRIRVIRLYRESCVSGRRLRRCSSILWMATTPRLAWAALARTYLVQGPEGMRKSRGWPSFSRRTGAQVLRRRPALRGEGSGHRGNLVKAHAGECFGKPAEQFERASSGADGPPAGKPAAGLNDGFGPLTGHGGGG